MLKAFPYVLILGFVVYLSSPSFGQEEDASTDTQEQAADEILAGHSHHGEAFNEGPRQSAYLMGNTGDVNFPVTTDNPLVQNFVNQGVGQLHGFWYLEAERSFRQAAALDPNCAIAYWGMALANRSNSKRAKGFIAEAVKRKKHAGEREQRYIDALKDYLNADSKKKKERGQAYVKALEKILHDDPDDVEAKAFLALQIYSNRSAGIPISSYYAVDALMKDVLAANPLHPVHHYRIHLWDYEKPELALDSAVMCGPSAPGVAHMWHMPGHIYSRLKRYEDAVWQQEASARVDHAHMMRDRVMPDEIHNFAHNNEWLCRNLMNVGRHEDALSLAKNMVELPRHPRYNTLKKRGSAYYGRLRLVEVVTRFERWDDAIALCHSGYIEPTDDESQQLKRLRLLGQAYFRSGQESLGLEVLAEVEKRHADLNSKQLIAENEASEKILAPLRAQANAFDPDEDASDATDGEGDAETVTAFKIDEQTAKKIEKAKEEARKPFANRMRNIERALWELDGHHAVLNKDYRKGHGLLRKASGVDAMYLARVQFLSGNADAAEMALRNLVGSKKNEVLPLLNYIDLLWRRGKREKAASAFADLREISGTIQFGSPTVDRLTPIARELGFADEWRVAATPADDLGERPELSTLGPFRWSAYQAPEWSLADYDGRVTSLKDYRGKPVIVIFYLGFGCLHCVEQLQAFAPKVEEFADAGLPIVAISIEDRDSLQKSLENNGSPFPFPLLADPNLETFKAYRAFDDFEDLPLHGTFLIDEQGRVCWQDISYEPFKQPEFLLEEAERLLAHEP